MPVGIEQSSAGSNITVDENQNTKITSAGAITVGETNKELAVSANFGYLFQYTNTTTITLTRNAVNSAAYIWVTSGSDIKQIVLSSDIVLSISSSGANGIDTGSVQANKCYEVRIIYNSTANTKALLATLSGQSPTLPAGYTYYSIVIGAFATNASSQVINFLHDGKNHFEYIINAGVVSLYNAQATVVTAIDLSAAVPHTATRVILNTVAANSSSYGRECYIYRDASGTLLAHYYIGCGQITGGWYWQSQRLLLSIATGTPTAALWYKWDNAPSTYGLTITISGFDL